MGEGKIFRWSTHISGHPSLQTQRPNVYLVPLRTRLILGFSARFSINSKALKPNANVTEMLQLLTFLHLSLYINCDNIYMK